MKGGTGLHLVDKLREKDEHALIELMNRYGDYLLRMAYLLVKDHQMAEEMVQDTFIVGFKKINQLKDPEKLKSWLTAIMINQCRSQMRKWSWKNRMLQFDVMERTKEDQTVQSPEEIILEGVSNQCISEAIRQLDYKYREVITLFYFNEWKITEIALHTKTNDNTIKSRLKRARKLLKDQLRKGEVHREGTEKYHEKTARY